MTLDTKELRRLLAEATPGEWYVDRSKRGIETQAAIGGVEVAAWMSTADAAAIVAVKNAAPALIDAAEDVERLRAFVPVWRMKRYSPSAVTWRLFIGNTAIPDTGLHPIGDGRVFASGDGEGYPDLATAARAVCDRLGVPYVAVTEP